MEALTGVILVFRLLWGFPSAVVAEVGSASASSILGGPGGLKK